MHADEPLYRGANRHLVVAHERGDEVTLVLRAIFPEAEEIVAEADDLAGEPLDPPHRRVRVERGRSLEIVGVFEQIDGGVHSCGGDAELELAVEAQQLSALAARFADSGLVDRGGAPGRHGLAEAVDPGRAALDSELAEELPPALVEAGHSGGPDVREDVIGVNLPAALARLDAGVVPQEPQGEVSGDPQRLVPRQRGERDTHVASRIEFLRSLHLCARAPQRLEPLNDPALCLGGEGVFERGRAPPRRDLEVKAPGRVALETSRHSSRNDGE